MQFLKTLFYILGNRILRHVDKFMILLKSLSAFSAPIILNAPVFGKRKKSSHCLDYLAYLCYNTLINIRWMSTKINKIIGLGGYLTFLAAAICINAWLLPLENATAQLIHLPAANKIGDNIPQATGGTTLEQVRNIVVSIVRNVKYVVGPVAVAFLMYTGFQMAIARGNEETYTSAKTSILWIIVGLAVISGSEFIAEFLDISGGGILKDKSVIITKAQIFDKTVQIVMTFIKYFLGALSVALIVISGFRLITMGDLEETVTQEKKRFTAYIFAFIIIFISNTLINQVVYVVDKSRVPQGGVKPVFNLSKAMEQIKAATNFMLLFVGPITLLMLLVGAIMYITAGANEDRQTKAKSIIKSTVIAMVIIFAAYALVGAIIQGEVTF